MANIIEWIWGRYAALFYSGALTLIFGVAGFSFFPLFGAALFFLILTTIGFANFFQNKSNVLANYPILAYFRFLFENIRPELRQYFWESDSDELPYSRIQRSLVYQRSKSQSSVRSFGSQADMYNEHHEWLNHSVFPTQIDSQDFRVKVGEGVNAYNVSLLNISGTSFGALSPPAIQALNTGAKIGSFAHNTGEGGISPYHMRGKGDLIWQVSTGYFGCRDQDGHFDPVLFQEKATQDQIKMIEIKLSQGAKPGHGGMLLGSKVTEEIALIRGVQAGTDCISPSYHSEFSTPSGLIDFSSKLREMSGGKPVGIKLCLGHPWELASIVKAMVEKKMFLDFITVDGSEGGTGAAPLEFTDRLGCPLTDALIYVDNALIGAGIRDRVKIAVSGKIVSAYDIIRYIALGADWCNMARPFMFSLGCIQALTCSTGNCPTGVATMNPKRHRVLNVKDRATRVANFHKNTLHVVKEMIQASGLRDPSELTRRNIVRRVSASEILLADQIYPKVTAGSLIHGGRCDDPRLEVYWGKVKAESFSAQ
ncbi:MAG: FMN-binding glutamate synthase family protein [Rhodospirillaceae bacterium TMED8]|nr:FMN-binding glutamate synthase family protein [Magnetovibrio sp.]OUT48088.1 MAG: FMN-binding glutamate synthase family protein [Rhodospirillaceae bacterium TMED8]